MKIIRDKRREEGSKQGQMRKKKSEREDRNDQQQFKNCVKIVHDKGREKGRGCTNIIVMKIACRRLQSDGQTQQAWNIKR